MKNNLLNLLITLAVGIVAGIILGPIVFRPGIPNGIKRDFTSCTENCDRIELEMETAYRQCSTALEIEMDDIQNDCGNPVHWTPACIARLIEYKEKNSQCNATHNEGIQRVRDCRIVCNNMISKKED